MFEAPLEVGPAGIEPHGAGLQEMLQVTPAFVGSFVTVALNICVPPASTVAPAGETET